MSKIVEKKVLPEYFERILIGDKTFELRLADFDIESGDTLVLKEYDNISKTYTGRSIEKKVTYVIKTKDIHFWNEEEVEKFGYQIISFK